MKKAAMLLMTMAVAVLVPFRLEADTGATAVYQVPADQLWETVDFHQPSENIMPPVASSTRIGEGVGAAKVDALQGGGEAHLLPAYHAPEDRAFTYTIQSSPLAVKNDVGAVMVTSLGDRRSELSWQGIHRTQQSCGIIAAVLSRASSRCSLSLERALPRRRRSRMTPEQ